jgi:hypothetical protein
MATEMLNTMAELTVSTPGILSVRHGGGKRRAIASSPLDLVTRQVEGLHDRCCLLDSQESVRGSSAFAVVLHEAAGDHGSNCCLFVTDGHETTSFGRQHDEHEEDDDRQRRDAQTDEMIVCPR